MKQLPLALLAALVAGAAIVMAGFICLALDVPLGDAVLLGLVLLTTGGLGLLAASLASVFGDRLPVSLKLVLFSAVAVAIAAANVFAAAMLMFFSGHDLKFLGIILAYALAVTVGPALAMGAGLRKRLGQLEQAASRLGQGNLSARLEPGRDELTAVALSFNSMAQRLAETEARRAEIESARRDLFVAVSHDLRTPLASIRAMVEALADGVVTDSTTTARYLESLKGQVQRLSVLIDDLFELARLDSGELRLHLEQVHIDQVVEEALDSLRPQAERAGVRLAYEPAGPGNTVLADPARLTRVLYNLVQNALRHTPGDGAITLRTRPAAGGVEVAVADTGEGIDPSDLPHVFERFYRGERSRSRETGGSGLGLSIARSIVEAHGGSIWVESELRRGATVRFVLPVAG